MELTEQQQNEIAKRVAAYAETNVYPNPDEDGDGNIERLDRTIRRRVKAELLKECGVSETTIRLRVKMELLKEAGITDTAFEALVERSHDVFHGGEENHD